MIFIFIIFIAWILYFRGNKVFASVFFVFFLTHGFQIVPEGIVKIGFGFTKSSDYGLILLFGCIFIDTLFIKGYLKIDSFLKWLIAFFVFLFVCMLYSKFMVHCTISEIIRTSRIYLFLLVYLIFRRMTGDELKKLLNILFTITLFTSILYLIQAISGERILVGDDPGFIKVMGVKLARFYNQPEGLGFFVFMSIFANPYKGLLGRITIFIVVATLLAGFHRSLTGFFVLALILGYILKQPRVQQIKLTIISIAFLIPTLAVIGNRFVHSRTFRDINSVIEGDFANMELDLEDLEDSTFAFRMGHLWERIDYLSQNKISQIFGAGLIPEDSKKTDQMFDFSVGLLEDLTGRTVQLETSDISYSTLFIRFGYVGTLLYLSIFIYMAIFFFKKRNNPFAFFSFLFLVLAFGVSFFSANILAPMTYILPIMSMSLVSKQEETFL